MKTMKIDNIPHHLEMRLKELAKKHNRFLNAQIIVMLSSVADDNYRVFQANAFKSIYSRCFIFTENASLSLHLLREDRSK